MPIPAHALLMAAAGAGVGGPLTFVDKSAEDTVGASGNLEIVPPAAAQAGDLGIICTHSRAGSFSDPAGFSHLYSASFASIKLEFYYGTLDGSTGTITQAVTTGGTPIGATMAVIRNGNLASPLASAANTGQLSTTTFTCPGRTSLPADAFVLHAIAIRSTPTSSINNDGASSIVQSGAATAWIGFWYEELIAGGSSQTPSAVHGSSLTGVAASLHIQ